MRVIEGWHPSAPSDVGYNVMVDGDWLGTFETLDSAARAAATHAGIDGREVVLGPYPESSQPRGRASATGLHLVQSAPADDA